MRPSSHQKHPAPQQLTLDGCVAGDGILKVHSLVIPAAGDVRAGAAGQPQDQERAQHRPWRHQTKRAGSHPHVPLRAHTNSETRPVATKPDTAMQACPLAGGDALHAHITSCTPHESTHHIMHTSHVTHPHHHSKPATSLRGSLAGVDALVIKQVLQVLPQERRHLLQHTSEPMVR